jgi:spermidine/putrescine transport system ATP-binding protein
MAGSNGGTAEGPAERDAVDVEVRNLVHYYGRTRVLDNVSLRIRKGEFFSLLGPSGSGKTTMLRIIGGFVRASSGSVYIQNELMGDRPPYERNTTMVFQHLALFPHMTVFDNVAYGLRIRRRPRAEVEHRVGDALRLVKLQGFEKRFPKQISGGQQQRVALARALVLRPSVVLFDEPLGALDLKLRREMQVELKNLQKVVGTTFVYVTHDQEEALTMSDRLAVMNNGRIEQVGTAEEVYELPRTRFVADFIGDTNLIAGAVSGLDGGTAIIAAGGLTFPARTEGPLAPGDEVVISIRPENLRLAGPGEAGREFAGKVADVIYTGSKRRLVVRLDGDLALKVDAPAGQAAEYAPGETVRVAWPAEKAYVLK